MYSEFIIRSLFVIKENDRHQTSGTAHILFIFYFQNEIRRYYTFWSTHDFLLFLLIFFQFGKRTSSSHVHQLFFLARHFMVWIVNVLLKSTKQLKDTSTLQSWACDNNRVTVFMQLIIIMRIKLTVDFICWWF